MVLHLLWNRALWHDKSIWYSRGSLLRGIQSRLRELSSWNVAGNNQGPLQDVLAPRAFINCTQTKGYMREMVLKYRNQMISCRMLGWLVTSGVEWRENESEDRIENKRIKERKQKKRKKGIMEVCSIVGFILRGGKGRSPLTWEFPPNRSCSLMSCSVLRVCSLCRWWFCSSLFWKKLLWQ